MDRLKELRTESGLLQKEVAQSIGVSPQTYCYYENGINKPDPEMLIKIADFFEVSIDFLLGRADDSGNIVADIDIFYSNDERQLIEKYRKLNTHCKTLINNTIDTLVATSTTVTEQKKKNS